MMPGPMVAGLFLCFGQTDGGLRRSSHRLRGFGGSVRAGQRRDAVPNLPHRHALHRFGRDGGVQRRQGLIGPVFAVGQSTVMGLCHLVGDA